MSKSQTLAADAAPSVAAGRIASNKSARRVLASVFGYESFRGDQAAIVEHVIEGGDALVLMPTGGGKSLCYQVPALVRPGTAGPRGLAAMAAGQNRKPPTKPAAPKVSLSASPTLPISHCKFLSESQCAFWRPPQQLRHQALYARVFRWIPAGPVKGSQPSCSSRSFSPRFVSWTSPQPEVAANRRS